MHWVPQLSPHWLNRSEEIRSEGAGCVLVGLWGCLPGPGESQEGAAARPLLLGLHVVSDLEAGFLGLPPGSVLQLP